MKKQLTKNNNGANTDLNLQPVNMEELKEKIEQWNKEVKNVDPRYLDLKAKNGYMVVRMYKTMMNTSMFEQVGQGPTAKVVRLENPFPYSSKALVISSERNYTPMTEVILDVQAIQLVGNAEIGKYPQYLFFTDDLKDDGYLLIPEHFVRVEL